MCCNILILIYYIVIFNSYFVTYTAYLYIYIYLYIHYICNSYCLIIFRMYFSNRKTAFLIILNTFVLWRFSKQNHHNDGKLKIHLRYTLYLWFLLLLYTVFLSELIHKNYYVHLFVIKESIRKTRLSLNFESLILRSSILQYVFCVILFLCDFCSIFLINFELLTWKTKLSMK